MFHALRRAHRCLQGSPAARAAALLCALLCAASGASAQDSRWVDYDLALHHNTLSETYDASTIRVDGDAVIVWSRVVYSAPQETSDGLRYDETMFKERFDCERRTVSILRVVARLNGETVHEDDAEGRPREPIPESVAEAKWLQFCEDLGPVD